MASLDIKQTLRLSQQLVMTPQLQQAIKLLQLNRIELQEMVTQEMMENPILEDLTENTESENESDIEQDNPSTSPDASVSQTSDISLDFPDLQFDLPTEDWNWDNYFQEDYSPSQSSVPDIHAEDKPHVENFLTQKPSLEEHLTWQLSMTHLEEKEKKLAQLIIGNLSEEGYLTTSLEILAQECSLSLEEAENIIHIIQSFDPIGIASRNLQECLLCQAEFLKPQQPLVETIIRSYLSELEKKNYSFIAKACLLPLPEIMMAIRVILAFDPKPGRLFDNQNTQYISPDIYINKVGQDWTIFLNEEGLPRLRISSYYKKILADSHKPDKKITKEYVQEKLRSALWLIRSIHNRQKTIYKVTEAILKRQIDFFEKGTSFLKPMILKDIAHDVGMHESTISRVTTHKFVHTPIGIFELKYFFNSSIATADGFDSLSSEVVKNKIKSLIQKEDSSHPFSDQKIVQTLRGENINIARRTVAKYRENLGIGSSSKRKKNHSFE